MTNTENINKPYAIHWFRRDLRIFGNPALRQSWKKYDGRVLGIFCFDSSFLKRADFSHHRFAFFLKSLSALKNEFKQQGGDLLIVDSQPEHFFSEFLSYLKANSVSFPKNISWNRDYEPFARKRDDAVLQLFSKNNIEVTTCRDHLILEPDEVLKSDKKNDFYQIYTPFAKKWFSLLKSKEIQSRIEFNKGIESYYQKLQNNKNEKCFHLTWPEVHQNNNFLFKDSLDLFISENQKKVNIPIPDAGSLAAFTALKKFKSTLNNYQSLRDFPATEGTSRLSLFLKNGSLTSSQIVHYLNLSQTDFVATDKTAGATQFLKEIVWREFYYSILWHKPEVEHQAFLEKYNSIDWQNNSKWFELWKEGKTGFPIIDAGMRELKQTGWMHNRVRMIVASFLTKDLLIDWRWGEQYFMETLLDGDLAANNGGWQWAASTGCDPQPYFRIFNPWLQSEKFDKDGEYIKKYIPELKMAPAKTLHSANHDLSKWQYPRPIIDHSEQRDKALRLYKNL